MDKSKEKLVLIDGNALIHRAFHALSRANLTSPNGEPTGAVYGFAMMLLNIFNKLKPDYIAVAFDTGKPTFRHEEYADYKATRIKAPQELYDQIPRIQELVETFNIPIFTKDGFEADDVIGTLAHQTPEIINTYIATGDMDALQLINNHTFVYAPRKGFSDIIIYDIDTVISTKGLHPNQFIDFKGLRGDPSDNIPGVPGIGDIGAKKLLQQYQNIENIYNHLDDLPERTKNLLIQHKGLAIQSKRLATILIDVPIQLDLKKSQAIEFNPSKVKDLFYKLGFGSLINKIPNGTLDTTPQTSLFQNTKDVIPTPASPKGKLTYTDKLDKDLDPILRQMEKTGILLDTDLINNLNKQVSIKIDTLSKDIHKYSKKDFNINSPAQLADILYNQLTLSTKDIKKTKTGYSTAVGELEKLIDSHPIIKYILEYRQLEKLRNTYLNTLPKLVDKNNRIHTTYAQDTSTGRLSSSNPNLQNIPIRSTIGAEIRKAFIAPNDFKILAADYSQIELRIVASLAKDHFMMNTFKNNEDIHTRVAAEINNIKLDQVTKAQRRNAKTINFGIIYGVSPYGLAANTGMNVKSAKNYIDKYFELYPSIRKYMREVISFAQKNGYVETLFGRKRFLPEIESKIPAVSQAAQRAAINMPVQGTAADILKAAMIEINKKLNTISKKTKLLLQVHDELVFEVPNEDVTKVAKFVKTVMENIYKLEVPIIVDIESGNNWGDTKSINLN